MERCCDLCHITLNKNAVVGDVSAMTPGGVRIGAPAMTSRGLKEADFEQIAEFLHEAMELCKDLQNKHGRLLKDFNKWVLHPHCQFIEFAAIECQRRAALLMNLLLMSCLI